MKKRIGRNIKEHRDRLHWTQEKLAGEAHVSPETVGRLEHGTENVTINTLQAIADAMHVTLESLLAADRRIDG